MISYCYASQSNIVIALSSPAGIQPLSAASWGTGLFVVASFGGRLVRRGLVGGLFLVARYLVLRILKYLHVKSVVLDCTQLEHDGGGNYEKTADVMTSPGAKGRS